MLSGEGNQNGEKTTIGLISIKTTLHVQHTFFVHFFAIVLHDHNVNFLVARFMEKMSYLLLFNSFHSLIFTLVAARISPFLTALKNFHVVLPTNSSLSSALAVCRFFSR